jgi:hypothetical protein
MESYSLEISQGCLLTTPLVARNGVCLSFSKAGRILGAMPKRSTILPPAPLKNPTAVVKPLEPVSPLKPGARTSNKAACQAVLSKAWQQITIRFVSGMPKGCQSNGFTTDRGRLTIVGAGTSNGARSFTPVLPGI